MNSLLNFRLYHLILFGATVFVGLGPTAEDVLAFVWVGAVESVVPPFQSVHVPWTIFTTKDCKKEKKRKSFFYVLHDDGGDVHTTKVEAASCELLLYYE